MSSKRLARFAHPRAIAATAVVGLVGSYLVAVQDPVPQWELNLTEWINGAPDVLAYLLYPIMQLGTLVGPAAVAIAAVWLGRDRLLAVASIIAGLVAWFGAKALKQMIERSRPMEFLPDVDVREGSGEGLGYISGHSAVAATAAVMAMAMLPRRWRPVAVAVAALVGIARIIYGVHLPADVVGGWSFGTLIGLGSLAAVDAVEKRQRAKS